MKVVEKEMAAGRCKDCKHWHTQIHNGIEPVSTCKLPRVVDYDTKIAENELAVYAQANDEWGLIAGLKTGPMFGCIKFQERNP